MLLKTVTSSGFGSTYSMGIVKLKKGREKSLRHRHPWIYSGAIETVDSAPEMGGLVTVLGSRGEFLARGYYNENSRIPVRVLEYDEEVEIDADWWRAKISAAIDARAVLSADAGTDAYRLVNSEADQLPGLVADRYGEVIVVQFRTAGADRMRDTIVKALTEELEPRTVIERSDTASRAREGLAPSTGVLQGDELEEAEILENGRRFGVDFTGGQKTGFYLDQRGNRRHVAAFASGCRVLDAFAYTGAFAINALAQGAQSATIVDSSAVALRMAEENIARNDIDTSKVEFVQADVFELLRTYRTEGRRYDMVVLDPPKFALSRHQLDKAMRGYKDVNMLAMQLLEPGGILATFSCSGAVNIESFTLAVSWASTDAGRNVQILRRLSQGIDHPVLVSFPESEYLKGMICRVS